MKTNIVELVLLHVGITPEQRSRPTLFLVIVNIDGVIKLSQTKLSLSSPTVPATVGFLAPRCQDMLICITLLHYALLVSAGLAFIGYKHL